MVNPDWSTVTEFENKIAEFFGAPHAVAVDSCTHGLELCLRYNDEEYIVSPRNTYVSVPMLSNKLNIDLVWICREWDNWYVINGSPDNPIIDAATYWKSSGYIHGSFMCLSFQYQKHLSLGRGGMILCPDAESAAQLRKMAYDGRERGIPWREQDIDTMGYHYYMTPETAALGLQKLPEAIATPAKNMGLVYVPGFNENENIPMKALIFGIAGQDGSYLSEYLLSLGYEVHGTIRRNSTPEHQESRISDLPVKTYYADLSDIASITHVLQTVMPDEIYNLAAQSHVRISFEVPQFTAQVNALGVLNLLEAYRNICPKAKFYQASSSEMFGSSVDPDGFQRETTPMHPVSPYGCSKVFAYNICRNYRRSYGLHITNGILFNHESPRRGSNFVTNKVVKGAVRIKLGLQSELELGNMSSYRDWGHSKDYVRAMHLMMQQEPGEWVVATGETHSVYEMCKYVFGRLGVPMDSIFIDNRLKRPQELDYLKGDSSRIRSLGWEPEYTFESMLDEMIDYWMNHYKKGAFNPLEHEQTK